MKLGAGSRPEQDRWRENLPGDAKFYQSFPQEKFDPEEVAVRLQTDEGPKSVHEQEKDLTVIPVG